MIEHVQCTNNKCQWVGTLDECDSEEGFDGIADFCPDCGAVVEPARIFDEG